MQLRHRVEQILQSRGPHQGREASRKIITTRRALPHVCLDGANERYRGTFPTTVFRLRLSSLRRTDSAQLRWRDGRVIPEHAIHEVRRSKNLVVGAEEL